MHLFFYEHVLINLRIILYITNIHIHTKLSPQFVSLILLPSDWKSEKLFKLIFLHVLTYIWNIRHWLCYITLLHDIKVMQVSLESFNAIIYIKYTNRIFDHLLVNLGFIIRLIIREI